jgi:hypothetical protein
MTGFVSFFVTPLKNGVYLSSVLMDSGLRRNDGREEF